MKRKEIKRKEKKKNRTIGMWQGEENGKET